MRRLCLLLAALMAVSLSACSQPSGRAVDTKSDKMKSLVAYFSATGTTEDAALKLAEAAGADTFRIAPLQPYTSADLDWRNAHSRSTVEMKNRQSRPAIVDKTLDLSKYSTVYIGFPIWWYTAPTIINTFLDTYDLQGKTIILFATSGGSTPQKALTELRAAYPQLNFKSAVLLNNASDEALSRLVKQSK